jgi:hypothetical protein
MCVVDFFGGRILPCDWPEHDPTDHSVYLEGKPNGQVIGREEMKPPSNRNE